MNEIVAGAIAIKVQTHVHHTHTQRRIINGKKEKHTRAHTNQPKQNVYDNDWRVAAAKHTHDTPLLSPTDRPWNERQRNIFSFVVHTVSVGKHLAQALTIGKRKDDDGG